MRILFVSDVYFPRINGVSTSIDSFRHSLADENVDVHVVAPHYPAGHPEDPKVIRVPARRVPFDPEDRLMHSGALQRTLREAGGHQFDLVHIQTPFAAHYAGLGHARAHGLPCIATYHTHFEEYLHNYVPLAPKGLLRSLARNFARRQCNALDAVVVPSNAMRDTLNGYGVTAPMYRVPTGIPVEHFDPDRRPAGADFYRRAGKSGFREHFDIPADQPVALFVGRTAHEKNIGFLLEAMPHALRECPGLILVIAGEGPALPALRRQADALGIGAQVRFVGYLDRLRELPECYAAADLFVFASRTETQGLVLLEAMAQGCPVVGLSIMGTADILEPGRGCRITPDDPADFAETLLRLLNSPADRARLGDEARVYAREWSDHALALRLAELYRGLAR